MKKWSWGDFVSGMKSRWITMVIWFVLLGILSVAWPQINSQKTNSNQLLPDHAASLKAAELAKEQFPNETGTPLLLVWYQKNGLNETDFENIQRLFKDLDEHPVNKQSFVPPIYKAPAQALAQSASEDQAALTTPVFFDSAASTKELQKGIDELKEQIDQSLNHAILDDDLDKDGLHVRISGPVGIQTDAVSLFSNADFTLLVATVAIVLLLLIILYRSPLLAIIPLITVGFAYGFISPLLGLLAKNGWIEVDQQTISIMTVLLFGAGTDYCLFLISRYRDELRHEPDRYKAMQKAIENTGSAIMMSSITTVLGLLTLTLAYYASYDRFAIPFSLSILIMGITALTLLPAFLTLLGRVAFFPFIPRTEAMIQKLEAKKGKKIRRQKEKNAFSMALGKFVTTKPWTIIISCLVILGVFISFVPKIQFTYGLLDSFPKDMPSREGFSIISDHYPPGEVAPTQVIVNTNGEEISLQKALQDLTFIDNVSDPEQGKDKNYQLYEVSFTMDPYSPEAVEKIEDIHTVVNSSLQEAGIVNAGENLWIGGETATLYDTKQITNRDQSIIIPAVLLIIGILLLVYFRSIIATIYLLVTVGLSYLAALGIGWILLHYGFNVPAIQGLIPLYSFVFLVALGEDYNIFLVANIWNKRKKRLPLKQAIAEGVSETGSVISSAGLILAGTFAVLAVMPMQVLVHFGTVTAIGILMDTFIIRPLLVPAITTVLGRYAFWPGKLWKLKDEKEKELI
ncbi:MMPL family transporter [Lederbergia galactosidilytica]|uniref:Membrane protein n=1 Tax=Lederbergia galactosidilytica TaxID=217031 RepID=A0A177ZIT9_9BACI|nr:MMPL family transporter [Lederbergia galactosidilytica]KRG15960.1 membrane protein [Virgibacillus soli]MBP1915664.1 RND superfamily putative drug exporter [Lederbergia galactosidilytica]OAK67725.1 membrane protein [Lederbergia galactosidilytica]